MRISILDYGLIDEGQTAREALQGSLALAQKADNLGYHRFWVAEHHNVYAFAISSPEILMAHLAAQTKRIRLGSGGIMGLHYSPYKVSEWISTLRTLYPNRIDLGLGNSLGTKLVNLHLESRYQGRDYKTWLEKLLTYLEPEGEQSDMLVPVSSENNRPFLLGVGGHSHKLAAGLGLGFVYGSFPFISKNSRSQSSQIYGEYQASFVSYKASKSYFILALFVVIADTNQEAERLATSVDAWMLGKEEFNAFREFPSPESIEDLDFSLEERKIMDRQRSNFLVGSPAKVKEELESWLKTCPADELLLIPLMPGLNNRLKALDLLKDIV